MPKYRIKLVPEKCISAASCVGIAPKTYELDENNIVKLISEDGDTPENVLLGAQSCPTNAIEIYDTESNERVWPKDL